MKRLFRKLFAKRKKIHPTNPVVMVCPKCGGRMKVVAFITEHAVVDRIMEHLKLGFVAAEFLDATRSFGDGNSSRDSSLRVIDDDTPG